MSVDEAARRRFETDWRAWRAGQGPQQGAQQPPRIEAYLPSPDAPDYADTLVELVAIELELAWKAGLQPPLDDYYVRFPMLDTPAIRAELETEATRRPLAPGATLGRYRLVAVHARGGFGIVWRAEDTALAREVAVKSLARPDDPDARDRFLVEARVTAGLEHPGIVPVHALGDDDAVPWYAMKLVRGRTLAEVLSETGPEREPLVQRRLLDVFLGVTRALGFAHARGLVHRDVKPDNVLVGDYGETVVLDWGLAHSPGAPRDDDGVVLGTPAYMAPEQVDGRVHAHDARTDVYALGAVLREVVGAHAPRPLAAIVRKAMAPAPSDRYADASALGHDVERFLADLSVSAHHDRWRERVGRSMRRHRVRWAVALVAALLSIIGTAAWMLVAQRQELDRRAHASAGAERDGALARGYLRAGHTQAAIDLLDVAIGRLDGDDALADLRQQLVQRRLRAERLSTFEAARESAWFLAGRERDLNALAAIAQAVDAIGDCRVLDVDLPPDAIESCRRRVHRLLLLDAALRAKGAITAPHSDGGRSACVAAWRVIERARELGPTKFGDLVQSLCALASTEVPPVASDDAAAAPPSTVTPSAGDAYFYGVTHLWLTAMPPMVKELVGSPLIDPSLGLDAEHPVATAVKHLREAVRLEPDEYWHHFMLGSALLADGDRRAASLVFGQCVALRPDYPRGLEARGMAAIEEGDLAQGRADFARALALAPDDAWTWWARANMQARLGSPPEVVAAYLRALALDPDALWRALPRAGETTGLSTAPEVERALAYARAVTGATPDDGAAWTVVAAAELCRGDDGAATQAVATALAKPSPPPLARTVRGLLSLRRGEVDKALDDLGGDDPLARAARASLTITR